MPAERTEQVMVRLTPDVYEALRTDSERAERTVAQTVRLAVRQYVESNALLPVTC